MHNSSFRFTEKPEHTSLNLSGRWKVIFQGDDPESQPSIGEFKQEGNRLTGTFLTATGDYRYLEGEVAGNNLSLSAFDGSHLFLFTAVAGIDGLLRGHFYSGAHWHDTWTAKKDSLVKLPDPESLTSIASGHEKFAFSFPDENGKLVSSGDSRFNNKVVIVEIMGTWCPNCLDETVFLSQLYNEEKSHGLEVVGLAYERKPDTATVHNNIRRLKKRTGAEYPMLFAGDFDKQEAAKTLPDLNRVFAYPTTIFIDRKGKVRRIHTGFSGPATGDDYQKLTARMKELVDKMLAE